MSLLLAVPAALVVAATAWRFRALDPPGALAATLVGAAMLTGQGWGGGAVLLAFFIPTTLVSRLMPDATSRWDAKGNRRDAWQVMANGGAAALAAIVWGGLPRGLGMATASLAAAAADTWATTFGSGSGSAPRSIVSWRIVPAGTSGAVSWRGTMGGILGAAVVAGCGVLVSGSGRLGLVAVLCGVAGMLLDSLLGATLQGRFHCPACQRPTERRRHGCGTMSDRTGGLPWLTNDGVNALATASAALLAALATPAS
jgi:uncharacterized protein (TIGR00297 family)